MDKYFIAVDMDGTLLDGRNRISDYTISVLQRMQEKGHYLVPASGRCISLLPPELKGLKHMSYAIAENGAYVWDFRKKEPLLQKKLPVQQLQEILTQVREMSCFTEVFAEGTAYTEKRQLLRLKDTVQSPNFIHYFSNDHIYVDSLERMPEILHEASKINLYFEDFEEGRRFRRVWEEKDNLTLSSSMGNVEITSAGVNKGTAVQFLAERLGIPKNRILVFGDSENDLEMFEVAGYAVAMANAGEKIRRNADCITLDCNHAGVAVFLETHFKEG